MMAIHTLRRLSLLTASFAVVLSLVCTAPAAAQAPSTCTRSSRSDSVLLRKLASKTGRVLAVEDHGVVGGQGSAVLEVLGDLPDVVVHTHGVRGYGESGTHEELYARHRLDAAGIAAVAKERFWANSRAKAAS